MVIGDFYIIPLSLKKLNVKEFANKLDCCVEAYKIPARKNPILYSEHFFAQNLNGVWYSFGPKERDNGDYSAEWFDVDINNHVIVEEKAKSMVFNIINECFNLSPIGYYAVLFRLQAKPNEKVRGVIKRKKFEFLLNNNKLKFNYLYIVSNNSK